jgi:hypothetical protein
MSRSRAQSLRGVGGRVSRAACEQGERGGERREGGGCCCPGAAAGVCRFIIVVLEAKSVLRGEKGAEGLGFGEGGTVTDRRRAEE